MKLIVACLEFASLFEMIFCVCVLQNKLLKSLQCTFCLKRQKYSISVLLLQLMRTLFEKVGFRKT